MLKVVELQHRKKEKGEDWASFGDALRLLADSAYPELEEKARECLASNQFLSQLDNPQVAFGVKQKRPQTVDEAALAAMELESYLHPCKPMTVGFLPMSQNTAPATTDEDDGTASSIAAVQTKTDPALEAIKELVERLDRLEGLVSSKAGGQKSESKKWNAPTRTAGKLPPLRAKGQAREGAKRAPELTVPALSIASEISYRLKGYIASIPVQFVVDTGASVSLLSTDVWHRVSANKHMELKEWGGSSRLVGVNGSPLHVQGIVLVFLTLSKNVVFENKFLVVEGMTVEAILGLDFLETFKCMIDSGDRKISFPNEKLVLPLLDVNQKVSKTVGLFLQRKLTVPAEIGTWLVERGQTGRCDVLVARAVVCPTGSTVPLRVFNPHKEAVRLWKGLEIAQMEPLDKDPPISSDTHLLTISAVTEVSPSEHKVLWDIVSTITHLSNSEKELLFVLLMEYADVFSFHSDLGRTNLTKITLTQVTLNPSINCPVMSPQPAARKHFMLDTDASDMGIGAILSQVQDDGGVHFTLRTDHGSLVWIQNFKEPEGQLARWLERLQEYTFTVVHRPGNQHTNVDALSRVPCNQCGRVTHVYSPAHLAAQIGIVSQGHSAADVHDQQLNDSLIGPVLKAKERGATPNLDEVKTWSQESRQLVQMWSSLKVDNSVLWRLCIDGRSQHLQLVLPSVVRESVLQDLHSGSMGGHVGESKMIHLVRERYYWPGWKESVKEWCRKCRTCSTRRMAPPSKRAPLQTLQAGYPLQIVAVDILGPLPVTAQGNKYVLVACDCFTRWVEVYAIQNQEALTVAKMLVDEMFCLFSPPEQLHSDQGRQFEADLLKEVCTLLQIQKTRTMAYHPHCNGLVERFNRTLLDMLSTTVKDHKMDWDQCIRRVCLAYNSSVHASTGYSPFYLMYGRQVNLPVDLMYGSTPHEACTLGDYAHTLRNNLTEAYVLAQRKGITEHNRQKALYDVKVHGAQYQVGDWVWLHSPAVPRGQCRKIHHPWTGPFKVVECIGECDYKIKSKNGKMIRVVHFDRLKPFVPGTRTETVQGPPPENPDENEALLEFVPVGSNIEVYDGIGEQVPQELLPHEEPAEDEAAHADQPAEVQHNPQRTRRPPDRY
ncbi:hypothetical protein EMCRGX_G022928 [Ephydatia muelleri]